METIKTNCTNCGAELEKLDEGTFYDEYVITHKCPECKALYNTMLPDDDSKDDYSFFNKEIINNIPNESHGYNFVCPICGHYGIWQSDFDVEDEEYDENYLIRTYVLCPNCGSTTEFLWRNDW